MNPDLKTPLKIKGSGDKDELYGAEGTRLATAVQLLPMLEAVRRVNRFDALVEALEWYARPHRPEDFLNDNGERAEKALALAKEGQPLPPPPKDL